MDNPTTDRGHGDWYEQAFDERQRKQVDFSLLYADAFHHGADGHNNMMIIAKMAQLLDELSEKLAKASE